MKWEGMDGLTGAQIYKGDPPCESIEKCGNRAAIMWKTPDHRAIDLCHSCSEIAFTAGRISDRFPIDHHSELLRFSLISYGDWGMLDAKRAAFEKMQAEKKSTIPTGKSTAKISK
jgi:hypothetical protein